MSPGRPSRRHGAVVLPGVPSWALVMPLVMPLVMALAACTRAVDGVPTPAPAAATPESAAELEGLIVTAVPSGRPRLPDDEVRPPAGHKTVDDVAAYSDDPAREVEVLEEYGYRYGWERFWGSGRHGQVTGLYVDQFDHRVGATSYAAALARNEAEHYDGMLIENAPGLPGGCHLLTVEDTDARRRQGGPAALAWCGHGVYSVAVTAVADSLDAAQEEVRAVLAEQMDRLPPR